MAAKKIKSKPRIVSKPPRIELPGLKESKIALQKMSEDIVADVYTSKLEKAFPDVPPITELGMGMMAHKEDPVRQALKDSELLLENTWFKSKDYSVVIDCVLAIAITSGLVTLGYALGLMHG
jgi:hypothetical protein